MPFIKNFVKAVLIIGLFLAVCAVSLDHFSHHTVMMQNAMLQGLQCVAIVMFWFVIFMTADWSLE